MKDDGSGRKIAVHAIIGGIMSQITGAGFTSGAVGAGLNEALINAVKGKDPGTAQIVSAIIGAAAAKVAGGSAAAGASAAAAGTKWNYFLMSRPDEFGIRELAKNILRKKDGQELSEEETNQLIREVNNLLSLLEPDLGHDEKNPYAEDINNYKYAIGYLSRHGVTTDSAKRFFTAYNETVRNKDWTGVYEQPGVIIVHGDRKTYTMIDIPLRPPIPVYNPFDTRTYQEGQIIGGGYSSKSQKMEDDNNPLGEGTHPGGQAIGAETSSKPQNNSASAGTHQEGQSIDGKSSSKSQKAEDDKGFNILKSIVVNGVSEKANLLPAAIKADGHFEKAISKYLKTGGVVALGWTFADIRQDWNTYNGAELAIAIGTDLIPLGSGILLGELGSGVGTLIAPGAGTVLMGSFGAFMGAVGGDYLKYRIRKGMLSSPNVNNNGGR